MNEKIIVFNLTEKQVEFIRDSIEDSILHYAWSFNKNVEHDVFIVQLAKMFGVDEDYISYVNERS